MATKQFYATKPFKFANRMLSPGEPVSMDAPTARLYIALKAITTARPRVARQAEAPPAVAEPESAPQTTTKRARRKK